MDINVYSLNEPLKWSNWICFLLTYFIVSYYLNPFFKIAVSVFLVFTHCVSPLWIGNISVWQEISRCTFVFHFVLWFLRTLTDLFYIIGVDLDSFSKSYLTTEFHFTCCCSQSICDNVFFPYTAIIFKLFHW